MSREPLEEYSRLTEYQLLLMVKKPDTRQEVIDKFIEAIKNNGGSITGIELHETQPGPKTVLEEAVIYFLAEPKIEKKLAKYVERYIIGSIEKTTYKCINMKNKHLVFSLIIGQQIHTTQWWRTKDITYAPYNYTTSLHNAIV